MKNERGITLIELLAAIAISGMIIVPLLTITTGTLNRTASQGEETQLFYFAQEVMEVIRSEGYDPNKVLYYCSVDDGCDLNKGTGDAAEVVVTKTDREYHNHIYFKITVTAHSLDSAEEAEELVTVVKP
ncbi:type IV pilus modification PilV family protein [Cytobacillus sp. NCCP-133]|uniref:type IV pilus modification PilV family protein n=1 Tax=Cytobacillus sp. NCCP-133 TaxID=766848 RepID=UPI002232327F|nr:type II secretion system protein [Cytobacillus sp. NCCP-133]GLB58381.1 hypothetical protein NCCP133_05140 [Cytobacillus sp. NCCP-133]